MEASYMHRIQVSEDRDKISTVLKGQLPAMGVQCVFVGGDPEFYWRPTLRKTLKGISKGV